MQVPASRLGVLVFALELSKRMLEAAVGGECTGWSWLGGTAALLLEFKQMTSFLITAKKARKTDEKASNVAVLDTASPRPASFSTPNPDRGKFVLVELL